METQNILDEAKYHDIMNSEGLTPLEKAQSICEMIEREEILTQYKFSKKPDSKGYWRARVPDITSKKGEKELRDRNLDNLKDRVVNFHKGLPDKNVHHTFHDSFVEAQNFKKMNNVGVKHLSHQNTLRRNETEYIRFFANTAFEKKAIDSITVRDLDEMIRERVRKFHLTQKGLASLRALINMTFDRAFFWGWIERNPASQIIWKDYNDMCIEPTPISEREYADSEIDSIWEFVTIRHENQPNYIAAYAEEWLLITAMRRGEVAPLLWEDINWECGFIYIHREQLTIKDNAKGEQNQIVEYTKNGKNREYPLGDLELEFLKKLLFVHQTYYPNSPYLFPADTPNGCITNDTVYQFHRRMLKKLGIPIGRKFIRGTHAFRRTVITDTLNNSNGNIELTARIYGNSPETIRKHYYTGKDLELKRTVINMHCERGRKFASLVENNPGNEKLRNP